jgi:hypothetical protein
VALTPLTLADRLALSLMSSTKLGDQASLFVFGKRALSTRTAANVAGIWLVSKTSADLFYRIASALLFGVALALIWQGAGRLPR